MTAREIQNQLRAIANPEAAAFAQRYFKTGPGQYGEGDVFLGLRVPVMRTFARHHQTLELDQVQVLLQSAVHEDRLLALLILVHQAQKTDAVGRRTIYGLYLASTRFINNWDLVDCSAPAIVGGYLVDRSRRPLDRLAKSTSLWERRIGIIATGHFIRLGDYTDTLRIAARLLDDPADLIHKATGWMLREIGKRNQPVLESFLRAHAHVMPRTMLRYAIERFPEAKRKAILRGEMED
jgi:3-methyladenine DNA glycosylase AlkD